MAQHDYVIANGTGAAVRSDLNNGLAAIVSNNSGATEPATMYAYQWWADTTTGLLKLRNAANSAWVTVGTLASANLGLAALASPTFTGTVTAPTFTASTAVNIPLGSAGSPTLFFTGDTNNGLFSPGADIVALTTDGSERFRIAASGQIGLGGANYGTSGQALTSNGSGSAPTWQTLSVTGDKISEGNTEAEVVDTGSDGHFKVTTEGSERLRVDSSGRLGLGSSTPTQLLTIFNPTFGAPETSGSTQTNGAFRIGASGTTGVFDFGIGAGGTNQWIQSTDSSALNNSYALLINPNGGNVGIGTTSPATTLDVNGDVTITDKIIHGGDTNTAIRFPAADTVSVETGGSERARIDSSGRLLVGTTSGNYGITTPFGGTGFYNAGKIGGITLGSSGPDYPSIGYNVRFSSTSNTYTYDGSDFAARIQFASTIATYTASSGTGGNALTFTAGPYVANLGTSWTNSSDERLKTDLTAIEDAFDKVASLRAVTGRYKTDDRTKRRSFLIAQDVQAVLPEAVDATDLENLGVSYTDVIPLLVAALKESKDRIETLEQRLSDAGIA